MAMRLNGSSAEPARNELELWPEKIQILCRKTEEALTLRRFRIRPTLCVFGCGAHFG
jgi:hypothetical protein